MRAYTFTFGGVTNTGTNPWLQLAIPANGPGIWLSELWIYQTGVTTTTEGEVSLAIRSTASTTTFVAATAVSPSTLGGATAVTSTANSNVITPVDFLSQRTSLTLGATATGIATGGASSGGTVVAKPLRFPWNLMSPLFYSPVPQNWVHIPPNYFATLQFETAPGAGPTFSGYLIFQEDA